MNARAIGAFALGTLGAGALALGGTIAVRGAEAGFPVGDDVVDGTVEDGPVVEAPTGAPALYGEVAVTRAGAASGPTLRRTFGSPRVRIATSRGSRAIELEAPARWRVTRASLDRREAPTLEGVPIVADADPESRLGGTYAIDVVAVRPGDAITARVSDDGHATAVHLGPRPELERAQRARDAMRWPGVVLLVVLGVGSIGGATRLLRASERGRNGPDDRARLRPDA